MLFIKWSHIQKLTLQSLTIYINIEKISEKSEIEISIITRFPLIIFYVFSKKKLIFFFVSNSPP